VSFTDSEAWQSAPWRGVLPGAPEPYFLGAGEGETSVVFGELFTVLLSADETQGQFGVFVNEGPAGQPIPAHEHVHDHEIFYVLDGAVKVWTQTAEGQRASRVLRPGDFGYVPARVVHAYQMVEPSKILGVSTGGFERFFHMLGKPTDDTTVPPAPFVPDREQMESAFRAYDNIPRFDVSFDD
jgi:quercetin 2,3-dioxygenase